MADTKSLKIEVPSGDLFDPRFEWRVYKEGYEVWYPNGDYSHIEPYLLPRNPKGEIEIRYPLESPEGGKDSLLFVRFAETRDKEKSCIDEERLQAFLDFFGLWEADVSPTLSSFNVPKDFLGDHCEADDTDSGEPYTLNKLQTLLDEIHLFGIFYDLEELIRRKDTERLQKLILGTKESMRFHLKSGPVEIAGGIQNEILFYAPMGVTTERKGVSGENIRHLMNNTLPSTPCSPQEELLSLARVVLYFFLQWRLSSKNSLSFQVMSGSFFKPKNLLVAVWFQFFQYVTDWRNSKGEIQFVRCLHCGQIGVYTPGEWRRRQTGKDKGLYYHTRCNDALKSKRYRERKAQMEGRSLNPTRGRPRKDSAEQPAQSTTPPQ